MTLDASIIVPARNEERFIGRVLSSILELTSGMRIEVLVVDNGSRDGTYRIAESMGTRVLELEQGTISAVRNLGARHGTGAALIFLDADVLITPEWRDALPSTLERLAADPDQVLGARYHAASNKGLLNRHWYNRLPDYRASYINGGNLMTSRKLFETLEGFDEDLSTAEDHDFCHRAREAGARVEEIPGLRTLHLGYPNTLLGFARRERWLGRQDFSSIAAVRESKVAWLALANLAAFGICALVALAMSRADWLIVYVLFLYLMSSALTARRFGFDGLLRFLATSLVYSFYLCGRSAAIIGKRVRERAK